LVPVYAFLVGQSTKKLINQLNFSLAVFFCSQLKGDKFSKQLLDKSRLPIVLLSFLNKKEGWHQTEQTCE